MSNLKNFPKKKKSLILKKILKKKKGSVFMNGCDYCVPNEDGITLKLVNGRIRFDWQRIMIWIKGGNIRFKMYQDFADNPTAELEFPVNYCPMCGRKLKEVE